jgi:hypothetical protein
MRPLTRPYICLSISVAFFLASTVLSDVIARMTIGGEGVAGALAEHIHYALIEPVGTAVLLAPFLVLGWIAAALSPCDRTREGLVLLCAMCSCLLLMYFFGYQDSQRSLAQHKWTAAALSVGALGFESIPIVAVSWVAFLILRKKSRVEP